MRIKTWLFVSIFLTSFSCSSQSKSDLIIGNWQNIKKATKEGRDTLASGKKYSADLVFEFTQDKLIDKTPRPIMPPPVDYLVKDDFIIFNGRKVYYIEKLTQDELIIAEYNPGESDAYLFRFVFRRLSF